MYVHKDFRGRGIGERLLNRMIEEAKTYGDRFHVIMGKRTSFFQTKCEEL